MTEHTLKWAPLTLEEVRHLFAGAPFRWWVTGGVALELFAGQSWRSHQDADAGICRVDTGELRRWFGEPQMYLAAGGQVRRWDGRPLSSARNENNLWLKRREDGPFVLDIAIGDGDASGWAYRRDPRVRRPWEDTLLRTPDGLPYLAPEIQLLFKSKGQRPRDDLDAETVIPLMGQERLSWLRRHLPENHPWQHLIDRAPPSPPS